jgi:hypothetical protein
MADCKEYNGKGKCSKCGKDGKTVYGVLFTEKCAKCSGSGNCIVCKGTGEQ